MPNTLKDYQSNIIVGLGTWTYTAPATGMYFISASATENPPSSISIVINRNGSPIATSTAPTPGQDHVDIQAKTLCAAADTITVVISSSAIIDKQLNTVKTLVNLRQGM